MFDTIKKTIGIVLKGALAALVLVGGPIALVGYELYEYAIERDNHRSLLAIRDKLYAKKNPIPPKKAGITFEDCEEITRIGMNWFWAQDLETVSIKSYDGLRLVGYYLAADKPSKKTMLLMHGYRCNNLRDFANLLEFYHNLGYNILYPYQRSHGKSEGTKICYGVKERYDVLHWTRFLVGKVGKDSEIVLAGISMGAATVLMSTGLPLPVQVKGVIADCGFTSPRDIFANVLKDVPDRVSGVLLFAADLIAKNLAGFGFTQYSAPKALKKCKLPVLFIHGKEDDFVPPSMTKINYEACASRKEVLYVEHAAHGTSNMVNPVLYRNTVEKFLGTLS